LAGAPPHVSHRSVVNITNPSHAVIRTKGLVELPIDDDAF